MDSSPKRVSEEGEGMPPAAPSPVMLLLLETVGLLGSQECQDLAVCTHAHTHTHHAQKGTNHLFCSVTEINALCVS